MRASSFTHNFLLLFSGPLIWAGHFVAIYGFTGILCARSYANVAWLGVGIAMWAIIGTGLVALIAMAAVSLRVKPRDAAADNQVFVRWMTLALSLLSGTAIVWETLSVFLVPVCN
jgi:NO-binding membrane sensor protein with MHYT domain